MKAKLFITILSFVLCLAASARASNTLKSKYESEHKKVDKIYKEIQERKKEVSQLTKKEREILSVLETLKTA